MNHCEKESGLQAQRLDKWLWAARFYKTRSLAAQAIQGGKVHLEGHRVKPSKQVCLGAKLRIKRDEWVFDIEVKRLNLQRRPAKEAVLMYEESPESKKERERIMAQIKAIRAVDRLAKPATKPNKKQRRDIVNFRKK